MEYTIAWACLLLTGIPALMILTNLCIFKPLPSKIDRQPSSVSVLIPARDEAERIAATIEHLQASTGVVWEIVILDDHSDDETVAKVQRFVDADSRIRLQHSRDLPSGWNGKQYACWQLSQCAQYDRWLFLDADVRVQPHAIARLSAHMDQPASQGSWRLALLSAFPHQQTVGLIEQALVPLMHFVLLGFLPMWWMRRKRHPAFAAGCGQMFMTNRIDYKIAGGHAAISASRHDGIQLPKTYRQAGLMTDVIDGTDLATVRMYQNQSEVLNGVIKNADEALARLGLIIPVTLLCLSPTVSLIALIWFAVVDAPNACLIATVAYVCSIFPRILAGRRFRQPWLSAFLHPVALCLFLSLQWIALWRSMTGNRVAWRGRVES